MQLTSPVSLAHFYWAQLLEAGNRVLDATCGHGKDALFLAKAVLKEKQGELFLIDIQKEAIESTKELLESQLEPTLWDQITYKLGCHSELDYSKPFKLVVYNLGYLPGSDKSITTQLETTLKSLESALNLLEEGGYLSITCYPGHEAGSFEKESVLEWASQLSRSYTCCHHTWLNRSERAPSLLLIQKN